MKKFAPGILILTILLAWGFNTRRQQEQTRQLDQKLASLTPQSSTSPRSVTPVRVQRTSLSPEEFENVRSSIQALLEPSSKPGTFRSGLLVSLQILELSQNLTTEEFISLVDQLNFHVMAGSMSIPRIIMARIAARAAPERLLTDPPSDMWKDQNLQKTAFESLLKTESEICRNWLEKNKEGLSDLSKQLLNRALLKHDLHTDPLSTLASMTDKDFQQGLYIFRSPDPAYRKQLAEATLQQFPNNPDRKLTILSDLLRGAYDFEQDDPNEIIHHLNTFFPDDPEGNYRSTAFARATAYSQEPLTEENIEKILAVARSISPEEEHDFMRRAASRWAKGNLKKATTWLDSLPASSLRDSAVTGFVNSISEADPPGALAWAATLTDPEKVTEVHDRILTAWEKKNPEAAETWKKENR